MQEHPPALKRLNRVTNFNHCKFMKKKRQKGGGFLSHFKRLLLIMKLTIFLIFSGLMTVSASIYSQATKLTLDLNGVSVQDVFKQIEAQSEFVFIYKNEVIDLDKKVNLKVDGSTVDVILDEIFKDSGVKYEIIKRQIILTRDNSIPSKVIEPLQENMQQPQKKILKGKVTDAKGEPIPGATVMVKGTTVGMITDADGQFGISIPADSKVLVFSFVGMKSQEIAITGKTLVNIVMEEETLGVEEVVIIGYGSQKKASVVGAITNTTNETLERVGGVGNLAAVLNGQIPGVMVLQKSGEPGGFNPDIYIRGKSTWNGGQPLILVDGVERPMNDIDVSEVQNVSVLKDASATAVFGVKGADGVILITTKRGKLGKPKLVFSANTAFKTISKLPTIMDSYDALSYRNVAIEHELSATEIGWTKYTPYEILQRYKKPQEEQYKYIYPNIDWQDEMMKDFASSYRFNMNISGGTNFAKYFGSMAYLHEGDIFATGYNKIKGYDPSYTYNRFNYRGNIDLSLTKTTILSVNLAGSLGFKKEPANYSFAWNYNGMFQLAPDQFFSQFPDGAYGYDPSNYNTKNPLQIMNDAGYTKSLSASITSDVKLDQKLDFITKGLSVTASLSYDNQYLTVGPILNDGGNNGENAVLRMIYPSILNAKTQSDSLAAIVQYPVKGINEFDFVRRPWTIGTESFSGTSATVYYNIKTGTVDRALFYQFALNYARRFGLHDISAIFLMNRRINASQAEFSHYREDWVGRISYNFNNRYFAEINGAYNGSEKFGPDYRFGFFPSLGVGWMLSNESFLKYDWLDKLKIRATVGKIGNDAGIPRWGYMGSWTTGTAATRFVSAGGYHTLSPYTYYKEGIIANPEIQWETAIKQNLGLEISVLKDMISLNADYFIENRENIFMTATQRNVSIVFGAAPVAANIGKTETKGYELELNFKRTARNGLSYWITTSMLHAEDLVLEREDPELLPDYQKAAGHAIGQTYTQVRAGFNNSWDEVYASVAKESNNVYKIPGEWDIVDYNGDGVINNKDYIPYGYTDRPQNTYMASMGLEYKGFNFLVQFYGVTNTTLYIPLTDFPTNFSVVLSENADYWTPENTDAFNYAPRFVSSSSLGDRYYYDASYLRLKTAEIGYRFRSKMIKQLGLSAMRLYFNGNNLFLWTKLPFDRETGAYNANDLYPMFKTFNLGINIEF